MKKLLPFFLLLSFFLTPTFASASAVTRESQLVNHALNSSSNTALRDVRVINGTVTATVDQRVALSGSSAILSQPVSFAADSAAVARSAAANAAKIAGGGIVAAGVTYAVQKLIDGVGWVMTEGAIVKPLGTKPDPTYIWIGSTATFQSSQDACQSSVSNMYKFYGGASGDWSLTSCSVSRNGVATACAFNSNLGRSNCDFSATRQARTPSNPPPAQPVENQTPQQVQDAFGNWLRNNPTSITDPVYQAMYTPAQTTGWNLTGDEGAHFGADGISDEMAKNILANRDAALQQPKTYTLTDSAQTATQVQPDGAAETNTTNPDGSKTKKVTTTTTDPSTGKQTTTTTTTVTQPDGTSQTTTQTTTTDATKTKTDIPAACEWFSAACDWFGWTQKDEPINDDPKIDQSDLPTPTLSENAVSWGSQCPNPQLINFNLMGQTANIQLSWTPVCTLLSYLYYPILAGAYIAAAYIVIGAYKS